jgi:hypothetical protein
MKWDTSTASLCCLCQSIGNNIDILKKSTDGSKELGLELNAEISRYMLLSCHKNAWQIKA